MGSSVTAATVLDKLYNFIPQFGLPHTSHDNFHKFCDLNDIKHVTAPAYHPASNGQAESFVKVIKKGIKSCLMRGRNVRKSKTKWLLCMFN